MDSVTQFTLGATVGVAVLGRRIGLRKAAITGGLIGTFPDLDVFWPSDDPVESFVTHRSASHSLLMHALITPLLGEVLLRVIKKLSDHRVLSYLAVFLCLTTHALLDSLTIYGTQLFWPIWKEPVGLGSIFIIDPIYTLPLLVITIWALVQKNGTPRFYKALTAALIVSSSYLVWGAIAQNHVADIGNRELSKLGVEPTHIIATPVPFSTLFWRVIATDRANDYSIYVPVLGSDADMTIYQNQRIPAGLLCWAEKEREIEGVFKTLADFADGFFRLDMDGPNIRYSDLRMGLNHTYAFQFLIAQTNDRKITPMPPQRVEAGRQHPGDMDWLKAGILGKRWVRSIEQGNLIKSGSPGSMIAASSNPLSCNG